MLGRGYTAFRCSEEEVKPLFAMRFAVKCSQLGGKAQEGPPITFTCHSLIIPQPTKHSQRDCGSILASKKGRRTYLESI